MFVRKDPSYILHRLHLTCYSALSIYIHTHVIIVTTHKHTLMAKSFLEKCLLLSRETTLTLNLETDKGNELTYHTNIILTMHITPSSMSFF